MKTFLQDKHIFITGGTGSLGTALVRYLTREHPSVQVTVFSRDEHKQLCLEREHPGISCVLGDIRDYDRLQERMQGHHIVIHTAALKQVPRGEAHPYEFTKTNITGTENVIKAAVNNGIRHIQFISSDKAVQPSSHYGSTKLAGEKLVISHALGHPEIHFSILRLGNVWGSRGSVTRMLLDGQFQPSFSMTDPESTRFTLTGVQSVEAMCYALRHGRRGEIFVPRVPAFRLGDVVEAAGVRDVALVGLRAGERLHETLLTSEESARAVETQAGYYMIFPEKINSDHAALIRATRASRLPESFAYLSDRAVRLTPGALAALFQRHLTAGSRS